jgi:PPK2 family polyphosphate:nucleotide phosphotransferase
VMSGVNPQGCQVYSFKSPSSEDLDHDYLWRCLRCLPERGRIGIFNRSYYEETLVVRVHPNLLEKQKLPEELRSKKIWRQRYQDVRCFERYLGRNGVVIRKFFLHVSKGEQKRRFLARLDKPDKNWKFSATDATERQHWDAYMEAYEDTIRATATERAPWYVVPADNKWFTRVVVASAVIDALFSLRLDYPKVGKESAVSATSSSRAAPSRYHQIDCRASRSRGSTGPRAPATPVPPGWRTTPASSSGSRRARSDSAAATLAATAVTRGTPDSVERTS